MQEVLIVDDDPVTIDTFSSILSAEGYQAAGARFGEDALKRVRERLPDLVLADLRLPDITGIELLRRLREERREVPVVIVTGFGTVTTAVEALSLGAANYVEKPLIGDDVVEVVRASIRGAHVLSSHRRVEMSPQSPAVPLSTSRTRTRTHQVHVWLSSREFQWLRWT